MVNGAGGAACPVVSFDDSVRFTTAYQAKDGKLVGVCVGEPNPVLVDAWQKLTTFTTPEQLGHITVFSAFETKKNSDTLAFVQGIGDTEADFMMSLNTAEATKNETELWLTLIHEYSHIHTGLPDQLDLTTTHKNDCTTYFSGDGCYRQQSHLAQWTQEFWTKDQLTRVDPQNPDEDAALDRCERNNHFFGPYAATNPEEDFAESFAAMVGRVPPHTDGQRKKIEWLEQRPDLLGFKERASQANIGPFPHTFDPCGT